MKTDDINSASPVKTSGVKAPPHNPGNGEVTLKFFWPFSTIIALSVPLFLPCVLPADSHVDPMVAMVRLAPLHCHCMLDTDNVWM